MESKLMRRLPSVVRQELFGDRENSFEVVGSGDVVNVVRASSGVAAFDAQRIENVGFVLVHVVVVEFLFYLAGRGSRRNDEEAVGVSFQKIGVDSVRFSGARV